ncbi:MAG: ornithine carbamoyltransferase [Spirochaetota bacterium]
MEKKIVSLNELTGDDIRGVIDLALDVKNNPEPYRSRLSGKSLFLLFQKTSTRTRVAFELGMKGLGGDTVVMDWDRSNFVISPIEYETRFLAEVFDCILARLIKNEDMVKLAGSSDVPVINACDNLYHPSQVLADLMTIFEVKGSFNTGLCYVGVHNNIANSLVFGCDKVGLRLILVTPIKDQVPCEVIECMNKSSLIEETLDIEKASKDCEFIYTDTWINMELFNREEFRAEQEERVSQMMPYQINRRLLEGTLAYVMHDMPVHPGYEIDEYCIVSDRSLIFRQAENRLYTAQALLLSLLGV